MLPFIHCLSRPQANHQSSVQLYDTFGDPPETATKFGSVTQRLCEFTTVWSYGNSIIIIIIIIIIIKLQSRISRSLTVIEGDLDRSGNQEFLIVIRGPISFRSRD